MANSKTNQTTNIQPYMAHFFILGYNDYTNGNDFNINYDTWRECDQKNYETGRLRAAEKIPLPDIFYTIAKKLNAKQTLQLL